MTPTCPLRVAATARRTAGWITSTTGTRVALPGVAQHRTAGRVARDDQQLDALVDELVHHLQREGADLGDRPRTVRAARRVTDVADRLVRQLVQNARATVSPPTPLSKIPIGASFMARRAYASLNRPSRVSDSPAADAPRPGVPDECPQLRWRQLAEEHGLQQPGHLVARVAAQRTFQGNGHERTTAVLVDDGGENRAYRCRVARREHAAPAQ